MYIIGAIIFVVYMCLTVWNIYNSNDQDKNNS